MMDVPTSGESLIKPITTSDNLIKPVPKPFSIEALISDNGPKRTTTNPIPWNNMFNNTNVNVINNHIQHNNNSNHNHNHLHHHHQQIHHNNKDTDSDGSLDMDIVQDLSNRRSDKDGKFN